MRDFRLGVADFKRIGAGLHRPECVLATSHGDLYVSDERGGVTQIRSDGSIKHHFGRTADSQSLAANGFALLRDGSFLVAPLIGGGVFRLQRHGQAELFLNEADGVALLCPNFVLLDHQDRVWICCLTQQDRKSMTSYSRARRDGYLVMVDHAGARIVADGIGFPNEVRVDPTGRYLYTNETLAARLLRYPLRPDGSLGPQEVIAEFDESNMFDGFNLDSEGGAWLTTLVSNRLWHVAADGRVRLLIEDSHPELLSRLVEQQLHNRVDKSVIYDDRGLTLKNISSVAFGGDDLKTAYLGSLMGEHVLSFRSPISGMEPAHWNFGPFD